jgi:hypothetical protein
MQIGKTAGSNGSHIKSRLKMEPHGVFKEVTKQCTNKFWGARFARRCFVPGARLRLGVNTSCSFFLSRENPQAIVLHSHKIGVITHGNFYYGSVLARAA